MNVNAKRRKRSAALLCAVGMMISGIASTAYGVFDTHRSIITFDPSEVTSYDTNQDITGVWSVDNGGRTLAIQGNRWKKIPFEYTVTPNTVLEFTFQSDKKGEIHAIGFDQDNSISSDKAFKVFGPQPWAIQSWPQQMSYGNEYGRSIRYVIPVGQYYTGEMNYLFFGNDHDVSTPTATSRFTDVVVHEGCADSVVGRSCYTGDALGDGTVDVGGSTAQKNSVLSVGDSRAGRLYPGDSMHSGNDEYSIVFDGSTSRLRVYRRLAPNVGLRWESPAGAGGGHATLDPAKGLVVVDKNGTELYRLQTQGGFDNTPGLFHNYMLNVSNTGRLNLINADTREKVQIKNLVETNPGTQIWSTVSAGNLQALWFRQGWSHVNNWSIDDVETFFGEFSFLGGGYSEVHANHYEVHRFLQRQYEDEESHAFDTVGADTRDLILMEWAPAVCPADHGPDQRALSSCKSAQHQSAWNNITDVTQTAKEFVTAMTTVIKQAEDGTLNFEDILEEVIIAVAPTEAERDKLFEQSYNLFSGSDFDSNRLLQDSTTHSNVSRVWFADRFAKFLGRHNDIRFDYALEADFSISKLIKGLSGTFLSTSALNAMQFRVFVTHPRFDALTGESRFDVRLRILDLDGFIIEAGEIDNPAKPGETLGAGPLAVFGMDADGGLFGLWDLVIPITKNMQTGHVDRGDIELRGNTGALVEGSLSFVDTIRAVSDGVRWLTSAGAPGAATSLPFVDVSNAGAIGSGGVQSAAGSVSSWNATISGALEVPTGAAEVTTESSIGTVVSSAVQGSTIGGATAMSASSIEMVALSESLGAATAGVQDLTEFVLSEGLLQVVADVERVDAIFFRDVAEFLADDALEVASDDGTVLTIDSANFSYEANTYLETATDATSTITVSQALNALLDPGVEITTETFIKAAGLAADVAGSGVRRRLEFIGLGSDAQVGVGTGLGVTINLSAIRRQHGYKAVAAVIGLQAVGWGAGAWVGSLLKEAKMPSLSIMNAGFIAFGVAADALVIPIYPSYTGMGWGQFYWVAARPIVAKVTMTSFGGVDARYRPRFQFNRALGGTVFMGEPVDRLVPFKSAAQGPANYAANSGAEKAIDGDINGKWVDGDKNSLAITGGKTNVWWSGDLGAIRLINRVDIHNRTDCCPERLKGMSVIISNENLEGLTIADSLAHKSVTYIHKIGNDARTRGKVSIFLKDNAFGRFVKIQRNVDGSDQYLNIAEVQVYTKTSRTAGNWKVKTVDTSGVDTLALAQLTINASTLPGINADFIDYHNGVGGTGHYLNNHSFPNDIGTNGVVLQAEGEIYIPKSGDYTFGVNADDGASITVSGTEVVRFERRGPAADKLGVQALAKGYHTVKVLFYDVSGGGNLEVFMDGGDMVGGRTVWDGEFFSLLTSSAGTHTWAVTGVSHPSIIDLPTAVTVLSDAVANGQLAVESEVINFNEGGGTGFFGNSTAFPGVSGNHFAILARAQIYIDTAGRYLFATNSDDGVELWVNDERVIYDNSGHAALTNSGNTYLTVGIHDIEVRYFESAGLANLEVLMDESPMPENYPGYKPNFTLIKSITGKRRTNALKN